MLIIKKLDSLIRESQRVNPLGEYKPPRIEYTGKPRSISAESVTPQQTTEERGESSTANQTVNNPLSRSWKRSIYLERGLVACNMWRKLRILARVYIPNLLVSSSMY